MPIGRGRGQGGAFARSAVPVPFGGSGRQSAPALTHSIIGIEPLRFPCLSGHLGPDGGNLRGRWGPPRTKASRCPPGASARSAGDLRPELHTACHNSSTGRETCPGPGILRQPGRGGTRQRAARAAGCSASPAATSINFILRKLPATWPTEGSAAARCGELDEASIEMIASWIAAGAPRDPRPERDAPRLKVQETVFDRRCERRLPLLRESRRRSPLRGVACSSHRAREPERARGRLRARQAWRCRQAS
jgi:hypothetical protein